MATKETVEESNEEFQEVPEEKEVDDDELSENSFDSSVEESRRPNNGNVFYLHV